MFNKKKIDFHKSKLYNNYDKDFINVNFKPIVEKNILKYQSLHILNFISIFKKNNTICALDFSNTGTGKTYTTIALCSQLDYEPIIICPKNVICYWKEICNIFDVKPKTIINYESIKVGKELNDNLTKKKSDIIEIIDDGGDKQFIWKNIDKNKNIIIFDEAHRCKNYKSINGKLLLSLKDKCRILLLSATLAQKYDDFKIFGYMMGFYKNMKYGGKWIQNLVREETFKLNSSNETQLMNYLYPKYGSKMTYNDMSKYINPNHISVQCYSLDEKKEQLLEKEYDLINKNPDIKIVELMKIRQKIEELKLNIIIDLGEKYLDENKSVVMFVNFKKSLEKIHEHFSKKHINHSFIDGSQSIEERINNINLFQNNSHRLIICMISAGSESISLHDLDGEHPRISLIFPSFSGKELLQSLGRIYRTGVKSIVEQKIIFCDVHTERLICEKMKEKVKFMNNFSDIDEKININLDI